MSSLLPFLFLAVAAGSCLPTQAGINAQLCLLTRSPVLAAAVSFAVGTLGLILYTAILRVPLPAIIGLGGHPWWIWSGGLWGAFFVAATIVLAPKLGAASMVALIVFGQMLTSVVLDHYGLIGYTVQPINIYRLLGLGLIIGGVVLIRWH
jgi:transporter family-2 protein